MNIGIVYLNYFSSSQIKNSIYSLSSQLSNSDTIYVGDNSNNLKEFQELKKLQSKRINVFDNNGNHGFSKGCNLIISKFKIDHDWILLINPDTKVHHNFLGEFRKSASKIDNHYYAISPLGFKMGTNNIWAAGGKFYWFRGRGDVLPKKSNIKNIEFGTCACLFVRRNLFESLG